MRINLQPRSGYMLRDLVVGIVVGVLALGILVTGCGRSRNLDGRTSINNNLRQLGVAVHTANGDFKKLPPALGVYGEKSGFGDRPQTLFVQLFPYIEQHPAYKGGDNTIYVPTFHATSDPTDAGQPEGTCFVANRAIFDDSVLKDDGGRDGKGTGCSADLKGAMPDGTHGVIMFATGAIDCNGVRVYNTLGTSFITNSQPQWGWTVRDPCKPAQPQPFGSAGISVCMGDAVTRTISPNCSAASWAAAMNPLDGKNPGDDF